MGAKVRKLGSASVAERAMVGSGEGPMASTARPRSSTVLLKLL